MIQKLISIIIPIYNAQETIEKTVKSIFESFSDFADYEIILIDDGSSDNSKDICKCIENENNNVYLISKKNGGVSSARNVGIQKAHGKYIMFVDSDDLLGNYIGRLIVDNINSDIDLLTFDVKKIYNYQMSEIEIDGKTLQLSYISQYDLINSLFSQGDGFVWNKVYSKSIIEKHNIRFDESLYICEDSVFNLNYYQYCNKILHINTTGYFYYQSEYSAYNNLNNSRWYTVMDSYNMMERIIKHSFKDNICIFQFYKCYMCCEAVARNKVSDQKYQNISKFISDANSLLPKVMLSKSVSINKKIKLILLKLFPKTAMKYKMRNFT